MPSTIAAPEVRILLTDAASVESAGAAVRACAVSKGFEAERATRFQVVVEELIRECRMREAASTSPSDVSVEVSFDGNSLDVAVVDQRMPLSAAQSRHLPSRRLLALGFADHLHIGFTGATGNIARCHRTVQTVRMRGPSSVTATVCSQCAARDPSVVTTVHSSSRILVRVVPRVSIGSMASTEPAASSGPRPG
jgi:anti-sigma regulatory factor (Ser/Thr protein kinase)